jgi:uncharacterized membrane protein YkoI
MRVTDAAHRGVSNLTETDTMNRKTLMSAALAAMLLAGGAAQAESDRDQDRSAADVKVTLQQAIEAAEKHTGGKAREAELEHEDGRAVYEVKVLADGAASKVYVSASDGRILTVNDERKERSDD